MLNPDAQVIRSLFSDVPLSKIINTRLFSMDKAKLSPGWLKVMRGEAIPESQEYGITHFVYRARKPFHPLRFYDFCFFRFFIQEHVELQDESDDVDSEDGNIPEQNYVDGTSDDCGVHNEEENEACNEAADTKVGSIIF